MSVVSVKVADIRPEYQNLKEWMDNPNNVYIGRKGIVFVDGQRFPKTDSIWANPFKLKDYTLEECLQKYEQYILKHRTKEEFNSLKGKTLGCWCRSGPKKNAPGEICHGDILLRLIREN